MTQNRRINRGWLCAWLVLPLAALSARADDANLLVNGDFSQGTASWSGDIGEGGDITDSSVSLNSNSPSGPVVLHLNSSHASRIYQSFEPRDSQLTFSIAYTLSPDSKFTGPGAVAKVATDIQERPPAIVTSGSASQSFPNPNYRVYMSSFAVPTLILANKDDNLVSVYPIVIPNGQSSVSLPVTVKTHTDYRAYIVFPPGNGDVTIKNISLTAPAASK